MMEEHVIAKGRLTWPASERRSDRYGEIFLTNGGDSRSPDIDAVPIKVPKALHGKRVKLMAHILETRVSTHVGDLFRGIYPRTPNVGDLIVLGEGEIFTEEKEVNGERYTALGLKPDDGRSSDWLNPRSLYDCHEQTVALIAMEEFLAER